MSLYEITRACGCVEEVQIRGTNVNGERERRAEWEATRPCRDCTLKAKQAQARAVAEKEEWPPLAGSPKQMAWAERIRAGMIAYIGELCGDNRAAAEVFAASALRHTDARWWIDRDGVSRPVRSRRDLVDAPGIDRMALGGTLHMLRAQMTPAELGWLQSVGGFDVDDSEERGRVR